MTKQFNSQNQIWYEHQDNVVKVGFTKSFLDSLQQCWHILPANLQRFREKSPLMVVETNDTLISIMSPVAANFSEWSDKAQNFPDQLTENDVVLQLRQGVAAPMPVEPTIRGDMDWAVDEPAPMLEVQIAEMREREAQARRRIMGQAAAPAPRRNLGNF